MSSVFETVPSQFIHDPGEVPFQVGGAMYLAPSEPETPDLGGPGTGSGLQTHDRVSRKRGAMQKILVVQAESRQRDLLVEAFRRADCEVCAAPDGLFALTHLERNRPDVVLITSELPGMEVDEFCRIVKKDAGLRGVTLAIIAPRDLAPTDSGQFDLFIEAESLPGDVVAAILEEAGQVGLIASKVRSPSTGGALPGEEPDCLDSLRGSLRILSLPELTQVICGARRTGRLELQCPDGLAEIYFLDGQVIHATHLGYMGLPAFRWILTSTLAHPEVPFRFESMNKAEAFRCPRTINMPPQRLLLTIAVEIDEDSAPGRGA